MQAVEIEVSSYIDIYITLLKNLKYSNVENKVCCTDCGVISILLFVYLMSNATKRNLQFVV